MKASEFYEYLYGEKPPKNFTNSSSIHIFGFAEAYVEYLNQGQSLPIDSVVQAKPEKVCGLVRQKFDDWVFGLETQAGEKLKVVDSTDFNEIITEIESELKDL